MQRRIAAVLGGLFVALAAYSNAVAAPLASSASTLDVGMFCEPGGYCEATASGGSGGYSFTWENATELADSDGWSLAEPDCWIQGTFQITATVTDSSGAQASATRNYECGFGG